MYLSTLPSTQPQPWNKPNQPASLSTGNIFKCWRLVLYFTIYRYTEYGVTKIVDSGLAAIIQFNYDLWYFVLLITPKAVRSWFKWIQGVAADIFWEGVPVSSNSLAKGASHIEPGSLRVNFLTVASGPSVYNVLGCWVTDSLEYTFIYFYWMFIFMRITKHIYSYPKSNAC